MINAAQFRADFPEFASTSAFTDAQISFWLSIASQTLNGSRWGASAAATWPTDLTTAPTRTLYDLGSELITAHNLALEGRAAAAAANGGIPGESSGMLNSKSVDKVSAGYDTSSVADKSGGHWNLTTYGLRYWRYAKLMGAGAQLVNVGTNYPWLNGPAWGGPAIDQGYGW